MLIPLIMFIAVGLFALFIFRFNNRIHQSEGMKFILVFFVMVIAGMPFILNGLFRKRPASPHTTVVTQSQKKPNNIPPVAVLEGNTDVHTLAFSPDGRHLVTAGHSYVLQVWDLKTREVIHSRYEDAEMNYVKFLPDKQTVLVKYMYGSAFFFWNPSQEKIWSIRDMKFQHMSDRMFDFVAMEGAFLAGATYNKHEPVRLWNIAKRTLVRSFSLSDTPVSRKGRIAISPTGKHLAATYNLRGRFSIGVPEIAIFDIATGERIQTLQGHDIYWIRGLVFSPDGNFLASGGEDEQVIVWDIASPENSMTFTGHKHDITDVAYSPNGRWLVSTSGHRDRGGCKRGDIHVWDVQNATGVIRLETRYPAWTVSFSPTGKFLAVGTACDDGKEEIIFWDVKTMMTRNQ